MCDIPNPYTLIPIPKSCASMDDFVVMEQWNRLTGWSNARSESRRSKRSRWAGSSRLRSCRRQLTRLQCRSSRTACRTLHHENPWIAWLMRDARTHDTLALAPSSIMPSKSVLPKAIRSAKNSRRTVALYAFFSVVSPCPITKASIDDMRKSRISRPCGDDAGSADVNDLSILSGRLRRLLIN